MVDGLEANETLLDIPRLKQAISARDVGEMFLLADALMPSKYASPAILLRDRQIVECFKKFSFSNSPFNKREKALLRFWEAEEMCAQTNKRLRRTVFLGGEQEISNDMTYVLNHARRIIAHCLGTFSTDEMLVDSRFGPGATLCVTGPYTTEYFKLAELEPTVSSGAFAYAEALLNYDRKWLAYLSGMHPLDVAGRFNLVSDSVAPELRISDHNKVSFVPKSAKTERSIAIEPYFNLYFQLGVGGMIRKRLKRTFNIDLSSQEDNQVGAYLGSVDDTLATIDFSMASDTIAREVVRLLIPDAWFTHLDNLRSKNMLLDGVVIPYSKFSSMGNGFTFELETLIFASVAVACCQRLGIDSENIRVFGDDVIIPIEAVSLFRESCDFLGFKFNDEKSFWSGPFRESCGKDYFEGQYVRPIYCDELSTVQQVASFSNRLLALNRAVDLCDWDYKWLDRVVRHLRGFIPKDVKQHLLGVATESFDQNIHVECISELSNSAFVRWCPDLQAWLCPSIRFQPRIFSRRGPAAALLVQSSIKPRGPGDLLDPREACLSNITGREIGGYVLGTTPWYGRHGDLTT